MNNETSVDRRETTLQSDYPKPGVGKLACALAGVGLVLGTGISAGTGAALAAFHYSTHVEIMPGVNADTTLQTSTKSEVSLGAVGKLGLPAANAELPMHIPISVRATTPEPILITDQNVNELVAMLSDPQDVLVKPMHRALLTHTEHDAIKGGALGGLTLGLAETAYFLRRARRQKDKVNRQLMDKADQQLYEELSKNDNSVAQIAIDQHRRAREYFLSPPKHSRIRRALLGGIMTASLLASASADTSYTPPHTKQTSEAVTMIEPNLTAGIPFLHNAYVTAGSVLETSLNIGLEEVLLKKQNIDNLYLGHVLPNIANAFAEWHQKPENQAWLTNPELTKVVNKANLHCSIPYSNWVFPAIVQGYRSNLIINDGDTMMSTGSLPGESLCVDIERNGLQAAEATLHTNVSEVAIEGAHDSETVTAPAQRALTIKGADGKPFHPITVLDSKNGYTTTIDGLNFVGGPDPRQSVDEHPTSVNGKPASPYEQSTAQAQAGNSLEKIACSLTTKTNKQPVILTHVQSEAYQSLGCVSGSIAAEGLPGQNGPYQYTAPQSGNTAMMYVEGTSSGTDENDNGFTPYEPITSDAPTTLFLINKYTNKIVAFSRLIIHPDGNVTLTDIRPLPTTAYNTNQVISFLHEFVPLAPNSAAGAAG